MYTMKDRLLDVSNNLLIAFPVEYVRVGEDNLLTSRIFFFRVSACYPLVYEYDKIGPMTKGSSKEGYIGDTGIDEGNDILRIALDDFHVYHVFITPQDTNLRIYKTITPVGDILSAFSRKAATEYASVENGSPFDFYTLKEAGNIFNPNQIAENIIFRAGSDDDGKYFIWGFYALDDIPENYKLYLLGKGYKLLPITDKKEQNEILKQLSLPPDKQTQKTIVIQVGGLNKTYGLEKFIPDSWMRVGNYVDLKG